MGVGNSKANDCGLELPGSEWAQVAVFCEKGSGHAAVIKWRGVLD
jgi:hypothetical protein